MLLLDNLEKELTVTALFLKYFMISDKNWPEWNCNVDKDDISDSPIEAWRENSTEYRFRSKLNQFRAKYHQYNKKIHVFLTTAKNMTVAFAVPSFDQFRLCISNLAEFSN